MHGGRPITVSRRVHASRRSAISGTSPRWPVCMRGWRCLARAIWSIRRCAAESLWRPTAIRGVSLRCPIPRSSIVRRAISRCIAIRRCIAIHGATSIHASTRGGGRRPIVSQFTLPRRYRASVRGSSGAIACAETRVISSTIRSGVHRAICDVPSGQCASIHGANGHMRSGSGGSRARHHRAVRNRRWRRRHV